MPSMPLGNIIIGNQSKHMAPSPLPGGGPTMSNLSKDTFPISGKSSNHISIPSQDTFPVTGKPSTQETIPSPDTSPISGTTSKQHSTLPQDTSPITGLSLIQDTIQSMFDPYTGRLPNYWAITDSVSNPITGYLPHLREHIQSLLYPFT